MRRPERPAALQAQHGVRHERGAAEARGAELPRRADLARRRSGNAAAAAGRSPAIRHRSVQRRRRAGQSTEPRPSRPARSRRIRVDLPRQIGPHRVRRRFGVAVVGAEVGVHACVVGRVGAVGRQARPRPQIQAAVPPARTSNRHSRSWPWTSVHRQRREPASRRGRSRYHAPRGRRCGPASASSRVRTPQTAPGMWLAAEVEAARQVDRPARR